MAFVGRGTILTLPSANAILIITEKFDPHADRVIDLFRSRGTPFFRLNTDDFHADNVVNAASDDCIIHFRDRWGRSHRFPEETAAVWYRKPVDPAPPSAFKDEAARKIVLQETLEFLSYPGCMGDARWINNPQDNLRAQRKFPQLRMAQQMGLAVPRTLITNDPDRARAFQGQIGGALTCKSMKAQAFEQGEKTSFIFSRRVEAKEFDQYAGEVAHCPTLLQEYVAKDHELRVTIFGEKTFCCRIDSQSVESGETDWRRVDPFKLPHAIIELDPMIEAALKRMLAAYHLRFGAFDLIVTPTGETVFLELNPNGQWLWIELITGAPMAEAMFDLLVSR